MTRRRDIGSLSPRLLSLSAKTVPVEPYPVTDTIEIRQTRARRDDLHLAYTEIVSCQQKLAELMRQANALPVPEGPADDATDEQIAAARTAQGAYEAQIAHLNSIADDLTEQVNAAGDRYNRAFFGEHHDAIMELTADWDPEFFDAFKADVNEHFTKNVNAPGDGRDDEGNVVDIAEAVDAGK